MVKTYEPLTRFLRAFCRLDFTAGACAAGALLTVQVQRTLLKIRSPRASARPNRSLPRATEEISFAAWFSDPTGPWEPDINKPFNMAFDAKGRLWVTTSLEYPWAAPTTASVATDMIFEDFGPDGRAQGDTVCGGVEYPDRDLSADGHDGRGRRHSLNPTIKAGLRSFGNAIF
jgi:hypothetical protein